MSTQIPNPKVDAYIAKAQPFAQPILTQLRELIHKACPDVRETIKWSRPFFEYRGAILCVMSAFKEHCRFGFWGEEMRPVVRETGAPMDRITSLKDLPSDKQILAWVRHAASLIDSGQYTSPMSGESRAAKPLERSIEMPPEFASALRKSKKASAAFEAFSPSCKREYVEWIADAKRPETRDKRIATAMEWIGEGKQRNWKYQNC